MNILKKTFIFQLATKLIEKMRDSTNTKQYYQIFLKNKKKSMKRSKIIIQQPKTLENSNIVDLKSVTIKHPKTSHKLFKAIRQAEEVCQVRAAGKNSDSEI